MSKPHTDYFPGSRQRKKTLDDASSLIKITAKATDDMHKDFIVTKVKVKTTKAIDSIESGEHLQMEAQESRPKVGRLMPTTNNGVKVTSSRDKRTKREEEMEQMAKETARIN